MASDYEHTGIARCSVPESLEEAVDALKGCTLGGRISCDAKVTPDARVSPGVNILYALPASGQQRLRDARQFIQLSDNKSWADETESADVLAEAGHFMVASCEPGEAELYSRSETIAAAERDQIQGNSGRIRAQQGVMGVAHTPRIQPSEPKLIELGKSTPIGRGEHNLTNPNSGSRIDLGLPRERQSLRRGTGRSSAFSMQVPTMGGYSGKGGSKGKGHDGRGDPTFFRSLSNRRVTVKT